MQRFLRQPAMRGATAVAALFVPRALQSNGARRPPTGVPPELRAPHAAAGGAAPQQQQFDAEMDGGAGAPPPPPTEPAPPTMLSVSTDAKGVTTLKLQRAPVNSLNLEFFTELSDWLKWIGTTETTKAVVLTSGIASVFSAGLDINELYQPKEERMRKFWALFQETFMILHSYPKPLVAAINGNCPAGGCILALACDHRVMSVAPAGQPERLYRIGLNETRLGIVAPPWAMQSLIHVVGSRKAERMLQLGETPTAAEALAMGLVDAIVEDDDAANTKLLAAATKEAEKFAALPNAARWMTRDLVRNEVTQFLRTEEAAEYDVNFFVDMVSNEDVQKSLGAYIARLSKGGKK